MPQPYLIELNSRLAKALANSPAGQADACARFVLAHRRADGGFTGRAGPADLYYTAFALRILALLGRLDSDVRTTAGAFAVSQPVATLVDLVSQLFSACMAADLTQVRKAGRSHVAADRIEVFRCPDGGYGKVPGSAVSSTYHTFLAYLCYDLLGEPIPDADRLPAFVVSRRRSDGGFAEMSQSPHSSINPTAAGAALSTAVGEEHLLADARRFLLAAQRADGGWPASQRSPAGDLLSTFTAVLTLSDLGGLDQADIAAAERFVHSCRSEQAGFAGSPGDEADVEYTFYGLGAMGILNAAQWLGA